MDFLTDISDKVKALLALIAIVVPIIVFVGSAVNTSYPEIEYHLGVQGLSTIPKDLNTNGGNLSVSFYYRNIQGETAIVEFELNATGLGTCQNPVCVYNPTGIDPNQG